MARQVAYRMTSLCLLIAVLAHAAGPEPQIIPAVNDLPTDTVGERHYCFESRKPTRPATFTFDDLTGWTVALFGNAKGEVTRTREAQIWSKYVAKVSFCLGGSGDRIELRPPKPIPLPEDFNCVNIWVRADKWYVYAKPPVSNHLSFRIRDVSGEEHVTRMGGSPWKDWFLMHRRVIRPSYAEPGTTASDGDGNGRIDMPAVLEALVVEGKTNGKTLALYLDHVSFYREELKPLTFDSPPRKNIFPTTPDTILPTCHTKHECRESSGATGALFVYRGEDGTLSYSIDPSKPGFTGVTAQWEDGQPFQPLAGGGPELVGGERGEALAVDDPGVKWETLGAGSKKGRYQLRWSMSAAGRTATGTTTYELKGKSLVIDIESPGGEIAGMRLGRYEGPAKPKLVRVPFLAMWRKDPHVLCAENVFVSAFMDWYVTDASTFHGGGRVVSPTSAQFNGGSKYLPKTDGRRNDMRERIFLTVSPRFDEVLPNIPNPPNPFSRMMVRRAWWDVGRVNMDRIRQMHRWGLRGVMMEYNGVIWEEGTDFIRRVFFSDGGINVGREPVQQFSKTIQDMGYLFGLHTDWCITAPGVFRAWDEDTVTLDSNGEWKQGWGRCYSVKVSCAEAIQRKYGAVNKDVFGVTCGYSDVVTAWAPWIDVDYDARAPMAGKLRGQFEAYGRMLRAECEMNRGPVISEGPNHWFYAGLPAGNYGQMSRGDAYKRTLLVDFDLLKIHPLQCDVGIGLPSMFYGRKLINAYRKGGLHSDWFDRWIAWTLACGHIAQITGEWKNEGWLKSFYMVQPAQQHYALVPVKRIRYFDGTELVSTSDAIRTGAIDRSQVGAEYTNDLTVRVNGSWTDDWLVEVAGKTWLLPPAGFVLHRPGELLEYSALDGSQRVDYVETKAACYLDSRGRWTDASVLATDGAAACFRDDKEKGTVWVVPAMKAKTIAVRPAHFGLAGAGFRLTAYDFEKAMKDVPYKRLGDKIAVEPEKGVAAYKVVVDPAQKPAAAEPMPVAPAVDFVISPRQWRSVPKGKAIAARLVVFVREAENRPVDVTVVDGQGKRESRSLRGGAVRTMDLRLPQPTRGDQSITITASVGENRVTHRCRMTATEAGSVVKDLMDRQLGYSWGYCRRGGEELRSQERMGPGPARFTRCTASCGGVQRPAIAAPPVFDQPPHGHVFGEFLVPLPKEPIDLTFGIGINETSPSADGVIFSVIVIDEKGHRHDLFKDHHSNGPWRDERLTLSPFAGQWVTLRFQTDCGPKDDANSDSARWAEPRVVYATSRYDVALEEASTDKP